MDSVVIIDYGSGNLKSVFNSVSHVLSKSTKCRKVIVTNKIAEINKASHIILPGVGSFKSCLLGFKKIKNLYLCLSENVLSKKKPFLGICVGMQMLSDKGYEGGVSKGFGWISGEVKLIDTKKVNNRVPHIGWNNLLNNSKHSFIELMKKNLGYFSENEVNAYFVHSYEFKLKNPKNELLYTNYGKRITAMVGVGNILGTQFHPERSQLFGLNFIKNFLMWEGF